MSVKKEKKEKSLVDGIHDALTAPSTLPVIKESEFKDYFMDMFTDKDGMDEETYIAKRSDWIGRVSHSELVGVSIVDDNSGKELCQVPALLDSSVIDKTSMLGDSATGIIDRFHKESGIFPNADKKMDAAMDNLLAHRIDGTVADNKWDSFLVHFGLYPEANMELSTEGAEGNGVDDLFE